MTGIGESDFATNLLPKEKISFLKMLQHFDPKLFLILKEELTQGNKIWRVYDNLPDEAMTVVLSNPFKKKYRTDGLEYTRSNDPHDSGDYYSTPPPLPHTLTAPN